MLEYNIYLSLSDLFHVLTIQGLLHLYVNCEIFGSSSVKNAIGNLMRIALNL